MHMRFHRGTAEDPGERTGPRSQSVHVLSDEDDLREALRRAAEFDQRTADMLLSRSAHYRALLADPSEPSRVRRTSPPLRQFRGAGPRPRAASVPPRPGPRLVVDRLELAAPAPRWRRGRRNADTRPPPVRAGGGMAGPITTWMVRGLGTALPLGMARSEPPMPMGTMGAPVRAERNAAPSMRSSITGPSRRVPSGKSTRHLALCAAPPRPAAAPRGRPTRGARGRRRRVEQQLAEPLVLPHLVLGHEEELAVGAEGGEAEVGEGAVDRGQDDRARRRARAPCRSPWGGTKSTGP